MNKKNSFLSFAFRKNKGFTLIEVLMAIAIFGLISGALAMAIPALYRTDTYVWHQSYAIDEARRGMKIMLREIREARAGDDGSYVLKKAGDDELIFFSDIDKDNQVERVRYFLGGSSDKEQTEECVSFLDGGSCSVTFSDFYSGTLEQAQVQVSIEGDFGWTKEYADIFADGFSLGRLCGQSGECNDCPGFWQGTTVFDVTDQAQDNFIQLTADSSRYVNDYCDWQEPNHSMKVQFILSWTESVSGQDAEFKKGVIEPTGQPPAYPENQEEISVLSRYVQNKTDTPEKYVFKYFDADGNEITDPLTRIEKTRLIQISLIINVDPNRAPEDYVLESKVQLRNLKLEEN